MPDLKKNPLAGLTIEQYGSRLRSGLISAEETTCAFLDRIAKLNRKLGAYIYVNHDGALEAARAIDASLKAGFDWGPLMGVPVAIKDLYHIDNMPLKAGSRLDISGIVSREGTLIRALKRGGCIILGKTWTSEFALGGINFLQDIPWNPWDSSIHRTPGGSSGGSAAAEAAGLCAFALGSDTGGSVRMPAALCGVLGHKFAADAYSGDGIFPLSPTLDSVGTFTSCAADSATIFTALTSIVVPEIRVKSLRVGKPEGTFYQDLDNEVAAAMNQALSRLAVAGAEIVNVEIPELKEVESLFSCIVPIELIAILGEDRIKRGLNQLDPVSRSRIEPALGMHAMDYISALMRLAEMRRRIAEDMMKFDCWITPTTPALATPLSDIPDAAAAAIWNRRALRNTRPDNVFGNCGVSLPLQGTTSPVGLQITCTSGNDARLLGITREIESILGIPQRPDVTGFAG